MNTLTLPKAYFLKSRFYSHQEGFSRLVVVVSSSHMKFSYIKHITEAKNKGKYEEFDKNTI